MIGRLQGKVIHRQPPELLLDVNGVAYEVSCPMTTFYSLSNNSDFTTLYTHLAVREDAQQLYGFGSLTERDFFRQLIKVNGVGPKMALAILSGIEYEQLAVAIHDHDITALVKVPGVGKKTAERLVIELKDKLKLESAGPLFSPTVTNEANTDDRADAESALIALGYKPQQASKAISGVYKSGMGSDELIRLALKAMV